jgi:L-threonylcarbamoyladenylate synthase
MDRDLENALETVEGGGVILYPTDTIWGLGCDATNNNAVMRIYDIKKRQDTRQMLILVGDPSEIKNYAGDVPKIAWELIRSAPRPLSIIFQGAKNLAPSLTGQDGTIGIRVVRDDFCRELIRRLGKPLISTSANISGSHAPPNYAGIDPAIKEAVDYVVEWRQNDLSRSVPSDIIKFGPGDEIIKIR